MCVQELEALRGGSAARLRELSVERSELQTELEAVHTEHAQRLGEVRQEQRELETRLEQLRQQSCACEPNTHAQQEAHYTAQVNTRLRKQDSSHGVILHSQRQLHTHTHTHTQTIYTYTHSFTYTHTHVFIVLLD